MQRAMTKRPRQVGIAVEFALQSGYKHIDAAAIYGVNPLTFHAHSGTAGKD